MNRNSSIKETNYHPLLFVLARIETRAQNLHFTKRWKRPRHLFTPQFIFAYHIQYFFYCQRLFPIEVGLNNSHPVVCNKFHFKLTASVAVCVIMIKLDLGTWRSTINSRSPRFIPFFFSGSGRELYRFVCSGAGPMHDLMVSLCVCSRSLCLNQVIGSLCTTYVYLIGGAIWARKCHTNAWLLLIWRGRCLRALTICLRRNWIYRTNEIEKTSRGRLYDRGLW